jgi:tetratricopeptide (TPR) repeat protein
MAKAKQSPAPPVQPLPSLNWQILYLITALIAIALYINTLGHDYTVDDTTVIKNNKFTTQGVAGLGDIFTHSYRAGFWERKEGLYRPLSVAMFALEWELSPDNPFPGHLINVLLYALSGVLLLATLRRLFPDLHPIIPLATALLWITHPLHTEVVAKIKSRDELLSFLFGIGTLYSFVRWNLEKRMGMLLLSLFCFFMALLSKESSVTWVGVIPLAAWCCLGLDIRKCLTVTLPYIGLIAVYFGIRISVLGEIGGGYELMLINNSLLGAEGLSSRIASAVYILGRYFGLFLFPVTLVFDYSYNTLPIVGFGHPLVLLTLLTYFGGIYIAFKKIGERNPLSFAILLFLGTFVLVSNVFFLIEATMAERFLYTPSLGLCLLLALLAGKWATRSMKNKNAITAADLLKTRISIPLIAVLLLFSVRTLSRNADWKDNYTLLRKDVQSSPESARIRYALGSTLLIEKALLEPEGSTSRTNYLDEAIVQLNKGVSILPNYNDAWYHLGIAWKEKGDAKKAVAAFEQARGYKPFTEASRLVSAGVAYGMAGQFDKAIADLREAVRLDSKDADAWNNLGLYLSDAGQIALSLEALDKALALRPAFDKAWYNRGNALAKGGDFRAALGDYSKALNISPAYTDALNNSGNCYIMLRQPDSALTYFKKAVEADPGNAKAVINLAVTYQSTGDTASARVWMEKAKSMGIQ